MRDNRSGFAMNAALACALMLIFAVALAVMFMDGYGFVHICALPSSLVALALGYKYGDKRGALAAVVLLALTFACTLAFKKAQLPALLFWTPWLALALANVHWLRVGIGGVVSERDYYIGECARIAMTDSVTQMRNMHAFLNDAPIYIKIARRYRLTMVVMVIRLKNSGVIRDVLAPLSYNEMLEALSKVLRDSMRLEDLAYFVDSEGCVWALNMFTHVESMDIVKERISGRLTQLKPDFGDSAPIPLEFAFGYAVYDDREEPTPSMLLKKAIEDSAA